jgi:hypothetical protein
MTVKRCVERARDMTRSRVSRITTAIQRKKHRVIANRSNYKLKREVFSHYCNGAIECNSCKNNQLDMLTIDHINNDGAEHRKSINAIGGIDFYRWLKNNGFPTGLQVLCWNCQMKKRRMHLNANPNLYRPKSEYVIRLKKECLQHYGEICTCGEADIDVLTLDHVNNDGAGHRKRIKSTSGYAFYLFLKRNHFPSDPPLQVLCGNCQGHKTALLTKQVFAK